MVFFSASALQCFSAFSGRYRLAATEALHNLGPAAVELRKERSPNRAISESPAARGARREDQLGTMASTDRDDRAGRLRVPQGASGCLRVPQGAAGKRLARGPGEGKGSEGGEGGGMAIFASGFFLVRRLLALAPFSGSGSSEVSVIMSCKGVRCPFAEVFVDTP